MMQRRPMPMRREKSKDDPTLYMWQTLTDPRFWIVLFGLVRTIPVFLFELPFLVLDCLLYTGRGVHFYRWSILLLTSVPLYFIADAIQTPAGDALFFVWALYTAKWFVGRWQAESRMRRGSTEPRFHGGVGYFEAIGLRGDCLPYLILLPIGFALLALPAGWLVGLLLVQGSIGGIFVETLMNRRLDEKDAKDRDDQWMMEARAAAPARRIARSQPFQDVRIE